MSLPVDRVCAVIVHCRAPAEIELFLYAGEMGLMARRRAGWRILFVPAAEFVHEGGRSRGDRLFGQLHASLGRCAGKHHGAAAGQFVRAMLGAGATLRRIAAHLIPGEAGGRRRLRDRAALSGPVR